MTALTELYCFILKGRLPLKSIKAMERSALPGRLEFELTGKYLSEQVYLYYSLYFIYYLY